MMKERGLTFCQELVPKVLDGSKFVTRRLGGLKEINDNPDDWTIGWVNPQAKPGEGYWSAIQISTKIQKQIKCRQGVAGDRFYMQEAWGLLYPGTHKPYNLGAEAYKSWRAELENSVGLGMRLEPSGPLIPVYKADHLTGNDGPGKVRWRSGRFQPRWACRPQRWELTSIRPERLHDISDADIRAEGCLTEGDWDDVKKRGYVGVCQEGPAHFSNLWNEINAKRGYPYDLNPWVWRVEWNPKPVVGECVSA